MGKYKGLWNQAALGLYSAHTTSISWAGLPAGPKAYILSHGGFTFLKVRRAAPGCLSGLPGANPWTLQRWASREVRCGSPLCTLPPHPPFQEEETLLPLRPVHLSSFLVRPKLWMWCVWSPSGHLYSTCWVNFPRMLGWFVRRVPVIGRIVGRGRAHLLEGLRSCMESAPASGLLTAISVRIWAAGSESLLTIWISGSLWPTKTS